MPGRLLGTLTVGLRAESRIGMIRECIKADPATVMLVRIYDVLAQVFSAKNEKPGQLLKKFIIEQKDDKDSPMSFSSPADFRKAWAEVNKREKDE